MNNRDKKRWTRESMLHMAKHEERKLSQNQPNNETNTNQGNIIL